MTEAIVIAARRTPIGRVGGTLRSVLVEQLAAAVLQAVVADVGLAAAEIDEILLGNALHGGNVARLASLTAGLPIEIPAVTIDRQCGSGLEAIRLGASLIQSGGVDVVIAGGAESVSTAPWRVEKPRSLYDLPQFASRSRFSPDRIGDPDMGLAAEQVAQTFGIDRVRQDQYALDSHTKALTAIQADRFAAEITPIGSVAVDECPRAGLTLARLAKLPPAFQPNGSVTVGNACPINDGAAAVVIVSDRRFDQLGLRQGLRVAGSAAAGVDPNLLGIAPVPAVQLLLKRTGLPLEKLDRVEFNEAFAAQTLACLDRLAIPLEKVNVGGGAIALGHPYGASGAILVTRLFTELVRRQSGRVGLATLGIAGGLGLAMQFETI